MNRLNRYLSGALAALLAAAAPAFCADLLVDDFTDPLASHDKWVNTDETLIHTVGGGSCTLDNSASPYIGEYRHVFSNKPAVFTLSYILKSVTGTSIAGAFFCRQPDSRSGYILTVDGNIALVYKVTTSGTSINAAPIFQKESFDLNPANNKLSVSKSGSKFNVFANDAFVGSFTDASYNSGDISLITFSNIKAVFGTVQVTDVFTEASPRTSFTDNFNGNNLKYWQSLKLGSPSVKEGNGVLTINTGAGDVSWMYIDFEYPNFTAKVETSHRSGSKSSLYGLVLVGEASPGQSIPMAYFAINGNREYGTWTTSATSNLETNTAVRGAAVGGTFFVDTLSVKKSSNQSVYEFFANGKLLASYPAANVSFKVVGVGLYCDSDLGITIDNFSLLKEGSTSITWGPKQISRAKSPIITRDHTFYDMRGRKRYSTTPTPNRVQTRAAGVYVNKNGRDVTVRKGRAVAE
jgi:hypothetical protein